VLPELPKSGKEINKQGNKTLIKDQEALAVQQWGNLLKTIFLLPREIREREKSG